MVRASALRRLERSAEALAEFQQVVRLDSRNASAYLSLGNLLHQADRKREAADAYRQAIRHDRTLLSAHYNLAAVLYELGMDDEALRAFDVALAPVEKDLAAGKTVDPATSQAFLTLGAIHARKQNWPRALEAYAKAVRLRLTLPPHTTTPPRFNTGSAARTRHTSFSRAVDLEPALPLAHYHLGLIELKRGNDDQALGVLSARCRPCRESSARPHGSPRRTSTSRRRTRRRPKPVTANCSPKTPTT